MAVERRYQLYPDLTPDMQQDVDRIILQIKALEGKFKVWGKQQDDETQGLLGLKPIPGQRVNVPDRLASQLFTKVLMPQTIGMPKWCDDGREEGYHAAVGAIFNSGAFCYFYGDDPDDVEVPPRTLVLVQHRKEKSSVAEAMGSPSFVDRGYVKGALGGYMKKGEESSMTAIREALEELPLYKDKPLFEMDESHMVLIHEGRDYQSQRPPLQYCAYAYKLSREDMKQIKNALADPEYIKSCSKHSKGETTDVILAPIDEVLISGRKNFRYNRQYDVLQEIGSRLRGRPQDSPLGYTLGESWLDLYHDRKFFGATPHGTVR